MDTLTNNDAIRMGNTVKGLMPNNITQSLINETIQVPIRDGNKYNEAFLAASDRLSAVLSGEADPGPPIGTTVGNKISLTMLYPSAVFF